jgi:outer membrane protein assembly factor BamB
VKNFLVSALLILVVSGSFAVVFAPSVRISTSLVNSGSSDNWLMFRHDSQRTSYSNSTAPNTSEVMWVFNASNNFVTGPVVFDGKVVVASIYGDIFELDAASGQIIWSTRLYQGQSVNNFVWSTPAVDAGRIFIGTRGSNLYCLNESTGALLWVFASLNVTNSSPNIYQGRVYINSNDSTLYCINSTDGSEIWRYRIGEAMMSYSFSSPAIMDGVVFVGGLSPDSSTMYAINALEGTLKWSYQLPNYGEVVTSPTVNDGKVYFASDKGYKYCLNADNGSRRWIGWFNSDHEDSFVRSSPAIDGDRLFLASEKNKIYCLSASTGVLLWDCNLTPSSGLSGIWSSPAVADGKVYVGSNNGYFHCINEVTGDKLWSYLAMPATAPAVGKVISSPAIYNGTVYIGCGISSGSTQDPGKLYAFGQNSQIPSTLTLSAFAQTSLSNFRVTFNGMLTSNQAPIAGASVQFSFSLTGGATWNDITSVQTASDGTYSAIWIPSPTGSYLVRATYNGFTLTTAVSVF